MPPVAAFLDFWEPGVIFYSHRVSVLYGYYMGITVYLCNTFGFGTMSLDGQFHGFSLFVRVFVQGVLCHLRREGYILLLIGVGVL